MTDKYDIEKRAQELIKDVYMYSQACDSCVHNAGDYSKSVVLVKDLIKELRAAQKRIEELEEDVATLWMLLDDIDTLDDIAKDDDSAFRKACYEIQQKRWQLKDPFSVAYRREALCTKQDEER